MNNQKPYDFQGIIDFMQVFGTDEKCREYLVQIRWNGSPKCINCGGQKLYFLSTRQLYKCPLCKKQFNVLKDTVFENSNIPLPKWFAAIFLFLNKRGISTYELSKSLNIQQHSCWYMLMKIRHVVGNENNSACQLHSIVEIDETFTGFVKSKDLRRSKRISEENKRRKSRGLARLEYQPIVFGMAERGGNIKLRKIGKSRKAVTQEKIIPIVDKNVSKGTYLISDHHKVYENSFNDYERYRWVQHIVEKEILKKDGTVGKAKLKQFVDKEHKEVYTNTIENVWMHLKSMVRGTYFHISYKQLDFYLDEFVFRYNLRKQNKQEQFNKLTLYSLKTKIRNADLKGLKNVA